MTDKEKKAKELEQSKKAKEEKKAASPYVVLTRKGVTVSRKKEDLQKHLSEGWKEA